MSRTSLSFVGILVGSVFCTSTSAGALQHLLDDAPTALPGSTSHALATCLPGWVPAFGSQPGVSDDVTVVHVHDDGSGPALYAAGDFLAAGGVPASRIAKWDGTSWSPLGSGIPDPYGNGLWRANAMASFDDGTGTKLFVGGRFFTIGGAGAPYVARWDGTFWGAAGSLDGEVRALAVFDDGNGPALYAGGDFAVGHSQVNRVARKSGSAWLPLGEGMNGIVRTLHVHDDGTGPALYAGGDFGTAGGVQASSIAKWDGLRWYRLGSGLTTAGFPAAVADLATFDDGHGSALYAVGSFTTAGGQPASRVARWDGTSWSPVGAGFSAPASALAVYDDGTGPALYAGGIMTSAGGTSVSRIARWDGTSWSDVGGGMSGFGVASLTVYDDGSGPKLCAGGQFSAAGGLPSPNIALWNGTAWKPVESGFHDIVGALTTFDDGQGEALYVGGRFLAVDGTSASRVARFANGAWSDLGGGLDGPNSPQVHALRVADLGGGPSLFVGGRFSSAGIIDAENVAEWDGVTWKNLGTGVDSDVLAFEVFDDGTGPALFAGGRFSTAGGAPATGIAKWSGTSWSALPGWTGQGVHALTALDLGTGPRLYAGGEFVLVNGVPFNGIGAYDGASWSPLAGGVDGDVFALRGYDDGSGLVLFVGGNFLNANGAQSRGSARWDGSAWLPVASPPFSTYALEVLDVGYGAKLYAAHNVLTPVQTTILSRWSGTGWLNAAVAFPGVGTELAAFDAGDGGAIYLGGNFQVSPAGDSYLARWKDCAPPAFEAYCFGSTQACPCHNNGGVDAGCANSSIVGCTIEGTGTGVVTADDAGVFATWLIPQQPALLFAGANAVNGGLGLPFGDGLRCVGGNVGRRGVQIPDANGEASWGPGLASAGGHVPGDVTYLQVWYRDPTGPCGSGFNLSNGLELTFYP